MSTTLLPTNDLEWINGDCMQIMPRMNTNTFDAVITDPPYASGGLSSSARRADPIKKYQQSGTQKHYPSFDNDTRDQRAHLLWTTEWMREALTLTKQGGWLMTFTDWRQLPLTSDAAQLAGWTWVGIVTWDKTEQSRPQKGMFRNQAEYIIVGTKGKRQDIQPAYPAGVYRTPIFPKDKFHLTGKPIPLMEHLMTILAPSSNILDPFAGSGTTLLAARNKGHRATGIELSTEYSTIAQTRLWPSNPHTAAA